MRDKRRLPILFWVLLAGLVGWVVLGIIVIPVLAPRRAAASIAGIVITLGLVTVIVGGFAASIAARVRWAAERFPDAVRMPIVTSAELAAGTDRLATEIDDGGIRLLPSKYALVAIDSHGVHVISNTDQDPGLIPASSTRVSGLKRVLLGFREFDAIVLTVETMKGPIDLPLTPMRLKGNLLRALTDDEIQSVARSVDDALAGRISQPGWPY